MAVPLFGKFHKACRINYKINKIHDCLNYVDVICENSFTLMWQIDRMVFDVLTESFRIDGHRYNYSILLFRAK